MKKKVFKLIICLLLASGVIYGDIKVLLDSNTDKIVDIGLNDDISFHITDLNNSINKYSISYNKIEDADDYKVEVLKDDKVIIDEHTSLENIEFVLPIDSLEYGKEFSLNVSVYKNGELLSEDSSKSIVWNEPSFSSKNKTSMNNKKYTLMIDGKLSKKCRLVIKNKKKKLYDKVITKNKFVVPTKYYKDKNVTLKFMLYNEDTLISSFKVTNKKKVTVKKTSTKISNVNIKSPTSYSKNLGLKDIEIEFTGGDNAKSKYIYIYENKKLITKEKLSSNNYTIKSNLFKKDKMYIINIEAVNGKSKKSDKIAISTISDGRKMMVELARKQLGNGGKKYWNWYYGFAVEWCAVFVSWLSNQNGFIDAGILPKFSGCGSGVKWFKNRNQFKLRTSGYTPKPGDIIFFDYEPENPVINHVGIVEYVDASGNIHTIEGNIENDDKRYSKCSRRTWAKDDFKIYGYGVPNY